MKKENVQRPTSNVQRRSKTKRFVLVLVLVLVLAPVSFAQNVKVVNPDSSPAAVKIVVPSGSPTPQPVKIADGGDVTLGAKADSAATTDTGTFSLIALFKRALQKLTTLGSTQTDGTQKAQIVGADGSTSLRIATTNKDLNAVTITTITTVWTPASGKKFRLMGGSVSVSAAMSVLFEDNSAGNTIYRTPKLAVDTPYNFVVYGGNGRLSATADQVLKATGSAAGAITGTIYGVEE